MKMRKTIKAIALGLAVTATVAMVQASVVNINFTAAGRGSTLGASYIMDPSANSMPTNYPGTRWNDFVYGTATQNSITNLLDTLGGETGIGLSLSGNRYGSDSIGLPVLKEYRYFSGNASTVGTTVTITNVPPGVEYDIYMLSQGDQNGRTTRFALGAGSLTNTINYLDASPADLTATTWTDGGNYVKFGSVTADAFGVIVIEAASLSGNNSGSLNGMQLVDLSATGPELETSITPLFGATYVTNLPTIEVEVTDGTLNVDTNSFTMALVLDNSTNDVSSSVVIGTPAVGVTTFSYTPVTPLENGAEYTVLYSVAGLGGSASDYLSTFTTAPDLHVATVPVDGVEYVPTDAEVAVVFTNVAVSLSNLYVGCELVVNSSDVTGDVVISYPADGVMKFEYAHSGLAFSELYDVQLNVFRSDDYTNTVDFSFNSALDPSAYLIAPGIRNGGFELVQGAAGETATVSDWSQIDNWDSALGLGEKTEVNALASEGSRIFVTSGGSRTYNITPTTINDGSIFDYKWTVVGRNNGVSVGLAYSNGLEVVIVSNSLQYVSGDATPAEYSGSYLFDAAKDPDAIGKRVGIIFIDDNSGSGSVQIDEVLLYPGNIAIQSVSPAPDATGVADTAPIEVVIAEAASQVDTNSIVLTVDGVDVTTSAVISDTASGVTVTYTPAEVWAAGKHFVSISASGTPEGSAGQSWSFVVDPTGTYLISPTVRNGSFELVDGVTGNTDHISDWARIDDWEGTGGKTEPNSLASDGSRIFVTGTGSTNYNMTTTTIDNGDRFGYSFVIVGRSYGVTAALAYMDGADVVVVSNSMTYVNGGTTPFPVSGEYTLTSATDPDAIGKTVGIIFIDNGTGSGSVQIDEVRLYSDETEPTEDPVFTEISVDGSTVTLSWTTQNLGTYSLQSKSSLIGGEWNTLLSGLPPGNTTTNVPASGDDQEFYQIKSE